MRRSGMGKTGEVFPLAGYGTLRVDLEQTTIKDGETLAGVVRLDLTEAIDVLALSLDVFGKERLQWEDSVQGKQIKDHPILSGAIPLLLPPLKDPSAILSSGHHEFPFTFQLLVDLAPSFAYKTWRVEDLENVHVYVEYTITVKLMLTGPQEAELFWSVPFVVEASECVDPEFEGKPMTVSTTQSVRSLGVIKTGKCFLRMDLDNDTQDAMSPVQVRVTIDNASRQALKTIHLNLYEDVSIDRHFSGENHHSESSRLVCTRRFDPSTFQSDSAVTLVLPTTPNDLYQFKPVLPTMRTHFIQSLSYRVAVECSMSSGGHAELWAPIRVIRPPGPLLTSVRGGPSS
ncbi:hypothetical protein Poli38472_010156 [Pythium oligandrum]|uniref:Arrestin-like N-terminal domain-containing protein n=1 Tax=Pythium oligandrum TaxID=41045 RepID=A0A8K1C8N4_PYTOL|nr:hypothetical protein Poli38472_010156 [Pythium oligandrum]|eukprot:TMW58597.1 hypothetical protein Poli38472_010156 [Pythium oligandrum]